MRARLEGRLWAHAHELCRRLDARARAGDPAAALVGRASLEEYARLFQAPDADELGLYDVPSPSRRG
ncbi:hypothetical protein ACWD5F_36105 [Streptomyces sp. NPDC002499]